MHLTSNHLTRQLAKTNDEAEFNTHSTTENRTTKNNTQVHKNRKDSSLDPTIS